MFAAILDLRGSVSLPVHISHEFLHVPGRNIRMRVQSDATTYSVYVPSRDRTITIFGDMPPAVRTRLEHLDAELPGYTQTQKYIALQSELPASYRYLLNIQGTHCGFALLSQGYCTHFFGIASNTGESLVMCDTDLIPYIRSHSPGSYWFFRMPTVCSGTIFYSTEALCSRWYKWHKSVFNKDLLRCFNALELMLFERRMAHVGQTNSITDS